MYQIPPDSPGFQIAKGDPNSKERWDAIHEHEGANTWRKYPEMFGKIIKEINYGVLELGCGAGILADMISKTQDAYKGYDISQVAVDICKEKGHEAEQLDIRKLTPKLVDRWCVIASEVMEHLEEHDFHYVMEVIDASEAKKFIFTVPDNCMGPEEIPQHTALFNADMVEHRMARYTDWTLKIDKADKHHLICVMERE